MKYEVNGREFSVKGKSCILPKEIEEVLKIREGFLLLLNWGGPDYASENVFLVTIEGQVKWKIAEEPLRKPLTNMSYHEGIVYVTDSLGTVWRINTEDGTREEDGWKK